MNFLMTLAEIKLNAGSDNGFIQQLITLLIIGICVGIVYAMGYWFFNRPSIAGKAPIAMTIWNGLFVLVGGIVIINFLLSLGGHGFIKW